jgi:predicted RNase H-like nuclease
MQTWNISAKIREVDNLLQNHPGTRAVIRECHPEICFYGLNDGSPMAYYKKSAEDQAERIAVLTRYFNQSRAVFKAAQDRFLRKEVARDDILDALAAAVTGYLSKGDLDTLPETPESDEQGLPMEMVYWDARAGEPGGP